MAKIKINKKEMGKKALRFLLATGSTAVAHKGIGLLNNQEFMQPASDATSKFNIKKIGASGGLYLASAAGAMLIKNEYVEAIAQGVGSAALIATVDNVADGMAGMSGMGTAEEYLSMYEKGTAGAGEEIPLAGDVEII